MTITQLKKINKNLLEIITKIDLAHLEKIETVSDCDKIILLLDSLTNFDVDEVFESVDLVLLDQYDSTGDEYTFNVNMFYGIYTSLPIMREILNKVAKRGNGSYSILKNYKINQVKLIEQFKDTFKSYIWEQTDRMDGMSLISLDTRWGMYDETLFKEMIFHSRVVYGDRLIAGNIIKAKYILNLLNRLIDDIMEKRSLVFNEKTISKVVDYCIKNKLISSKVSLEKLMRGEAAASTVIEFNRPSNFLAKIFRTLYQNKDIHIQKQILTDWLCTHFTTLYNTKFIHPKKSYIYKALTTNKEEFKYLSSDEVIF